MGYSLGIDLGGAKILSSVLDDEANILSRSKKKTKAEGGAEDVIGRIVDVARKALDKAIVIEREGDKLKSDSALKYTKAIDAFEKIAKDYPFKDIVVEANRHSGEILSKMTGFGKKPF